MVAGAGVFAYRRWAFGGDSSLAGSDVRETARALRGIPKSVLLAAVVYAVVFAPTLAWFYRQWTASVWENGHGLLVPVAVLYFGVRLLRGEGDRPAEASAWGFVPLVAGLLMAVTDVSLGTRYLAAAGFVMTLPGLSLLFLGARRTRRLALPLALSVFMIPIPTAVSDVVGMRLLTAEGAAAALRAVGYAVHQNYTLLALPRFSIDVTYACSGFAALYAGSFTAVSLAGFAPSRWRKLAVLAAILPAALLSNIFRVVLLALLASAFGTEVFDSALHPASGALAFAVVIGILACVAGRRTLRAMFE